MQGGGVKIENILDSADITFAFHFLVMVGIGDTPVYGYVPLKRQAECSPLSHSPETVARVAGATLKQGDLDAAFLGRFLGFVVAGIDMADHSHGRVVSQNAAQALGSLGCAVGHTDHAGM